MKTVDKFSLHGFSYYIGEDLKVKNNRFLARHSKSSAMVVSLAIHAVLIVVAISFVAVKVIVKEEPAFEAKRVKRPKMPPKKIQVPVDVKKSKPKPRLRKRIVSTKTFTDIQMPEITGVAGGLGNMGGDGLGSLGFDLKFNFFGARGGGRHVVFVIDYSQSMVHGGKEAIMRREAARVISELPKTTNFAVIFFAGPAWPAASNLERFVSDWVKTGNDAHSFRPKDWDDLPRMKYKTASTSVCSSMVDTIETTPLVYGTVYDCPLYMALSMDPTPDVIFFITDGSCDPERGIVPFRKMLAQLQAAGKKVPKVNTVGFGISGNSQLKEIARLTEGECHFLTAADYIRRFGAVEPKPQKLKPGFKISTIKSVTAAEYPVEFTLQ